MRSLSGSGIVWLMGAWSNAEIDAAFGDLDPVRRAAVEANLDAIDQLLRGVASALDCGFQCTTHGSAPSSAWKGVQTELSAARDIRNEDGTRSSGALDAVMTIERAPDHEGRWLVWTHVAQNCNRLRCAEDPHRCHHEEGEADSAMDAADLGLAMTSRLVDWLRARTRSELDYLVHE